MREPCPTPATVLVDKLVARYGKSLAHDELDRILDQIPTVDLAGLACDWEGFWARPKQVLPATDWLTFGYLAGRGNGKTRSIAYFINREVRAGRAMCIGLASQNEDKTVAVQVRGLIETAEPRFVPVYISSAKELHWPNGAVAYAFTPEAPDNIRSPNMNLCWLSELQSWPASTREEALMNFAFATRVGYARTVWDATPKRGHPILKRFVARSQRAPALHVIVGGTIYENRRNLSAKAIQKLDEEYGGTRQGREELLGEMLEDSENALVRIGWIDDHRRNTPTQFVRRVISVDPALSHHRRSDRTGLVEAGLGVDGQLYVLADHSGKYAPGEWAALVVDTYVSNRCDTVIVERNAGGDYVESNLRSYAVDRRQLNVQKIGENDRPSHVAGTIFLREVHSRGAKEDRAQPLATAYERGRVSHVQKFVGLEELLTTWEPGTGQRSPDALDALVHAATDLLGLMMNAPDPSLAFRGIAELGKALAAPVRGPTNIATLLGGGGAGGRI